MLKQEGFLLNYLKVLSFLIFQQFSYDTDFLSRTLVMKVCIQTQQWVVMACMASNFAGIMLLLSSSAPAPAQIPAPAQVKSTQ